MKDTEVIKRTEEYVRKELASEGSGHDFWHVYRVWKMAKRISRKEKANILVVELSALLHDIADWKFNSGDVTAGARVSREWLNKLGVNKDIVDRVCYIVENISFKGGTNKVKIGTIEGEIVQDADRLDAIGAIGIARAFAFGGHQGRIMFDSSIKPMKFKNFEHFRTSMKNNTTVNHFYEKLLLLKDLMNTDTARQIAQERHEYMEKYLQRFYKEWEGEE